MPAQHHRLVLGVLDTLPKTLELYQALLGTEASDSSPIILTQSISNAHRESLRQAGVTENGLIEGIGWHTENLLAKPSSKSAHWPEDLIRRLIDHSPELISSLADDYLSQGQFLIAQSLQGLQEAEISITKLILRFANERCHVLDLR